MSINLELGCVGLAQVEECFCIVFFLNLIFFFLLFWFVIIFYGLWCSIGMDLITGGN